jgi:subtilisin family serine protease
LQPKLRPKIGSGLEFRLGSAHDYDVLEVNVFLHEEPARQVAAMRDVSDAEPDGAREWNPVRVARELREAAGRAQAGLMQFLSQRGREVGFTDEVASVPAAEMLEPIWINNAVPARVTRDVLHQIVARDDVAFVELERHAPLEELLDAQRGARKTAGGKAAGRKSARGKRQVSRRKKPARAEDQVRTAWGVQLINAPLMWQHGLTGEGVVVAVIDTGVNYEHPDLKSHMWDGGTQFPRHGYDFADDHPDPRDTDGHGTACAGQVAGDGTSGIRTGVAPEARIMALRVGGQERNFWRAMQFALDHGAHVISMSMSWKYPVQPDYPGWRRACESVLAAGVLHANSIGNQGQLLGTHPIPYNIATPGNCPPPWLHPLQSPRGGLTSVVSVGATDDLDRLANYSGRGPAAWEVGPYHDYPYGGGASAGLLKPDLCAPGPGTISCNWQYPDVPGARPYRDFGGTSAATPHVGGCLALLVQACLRSGRPIVPERIQEALENTAVRVDGQSRDKENHYGAGRVDLYAAWQYGTRREWWE